MPYLKKRGKYYYVRYHRVIDGEEVWITKSLGIKDRYSAEIALRKLKELEDANKIDPHSPNFEQRRIIKAGSARNLTNVYYVREAADFFYRKKQHLSDSTVKNSDNSSINSQGAYEQAIEYFIRKNDVAKLPVSEITIEHFENIIFKPGIASATRHYYFRQLRVWWNVLLRKNIVIDDFFEELVKDLPELKANIRPKMLTESELEILFEAFDEELAEKAKNKHFTDSQIQYWFKPLIATYFYGGLRKHEAAYNPDIPYSGLKGENLIFEDDELVMIWLGATKGCKERYIPISQSWKVYMDDYFEIRGYPNQDQHLFIYTGGHRKGWPVTGSRVYRQFKEYLKSSGLPSSRTLHGLRHQRITSWIESGYNTSEAQFMAGHSSVKVTEKYTHLTGKKLLEKQRKIDGELL